MKIQDVIFLIVLGVVLSKHSPKLTAFFGILCLISAIPLFSFWVFFTAQRFVWYAAVFFLLSVIFSLWQHNKK